MGSKRQRRQKQKARKQAARSRREGSVPPRTFDIEQQGRFLQIRNEPTAEDLAGLRASLIAARPGLESRVSETRERLVEILRSVDPADLVARASLTYLRFDPNTYLESEDDHSPSHIEYLALQALAVGLDSPSTVHPGRAVQLTYEAIGLVRSLFSDTGMHIMLLALEESEREKKPITEYQLRARQNSLVVRGTGYPEHLERVISGCFGALDDLCARVLGFTGSDALSVHAGICKLIADRVNERTALAPERIAETTREVKRARRSGTRGMFPDWLLDLAPSKAKSEIEDMVQSWIFLDSRSLAVFTADDVAEVTGLRLEVVESCLEAFVCEPAEFDEEHHKFPAGAHPLTTKPVLRTEDGYLIPATRTVLEAIRPRMEDLLSEDSSAWETYVQHRGKFVEDEARRLLANAFPDSCSWTNIEWRSETDESDLDALVDCHELAIRLQCKSGRVTAPSRRGAPERMRDELDKLIGEAAEQHARLADSLEHYTPSALGLTDDVVQALSRPLQVEAIVTLDNVTTWATHAHQLRGIDVLPASRPVPWILSLTDLMVVADLLEGASLAHYLIRRQRLERDGRIYAYDELDWVGSYVFEGLFFDSYFEGEDPLTRLQLFTHTEDIDAWYFTRQGIRTENPAPKPSQQIPEQLEVLLRRLSAERPANWLVASLALLDGGDDWRNSWAEGVERIRSKVQTAGASDMSQMFSHLGLTIYVDHHANPAVVRTQARKYAQRKATELDRANWIVIGEGPDNKLFVVLHAGHGTSELFECFLTPNAQRPE